MGDPSLKHALPIALSLLRDLRQPDAPALTDATTMAAWEAQYMLRAHLLHLSDNIAEDAFDLSSTRHSNESNPTLLSPQEDLLHKQNALVSSLETLAASLDEALAARVAAAPHKPRLYRLAERVGLRADGELRALVFLVVTSAGFTRAAPGCPQDAFHDKRTALARCRLFAGLDGAGLLHFLSPSRAHFRQGLLDINESYAQTYKDTAVFAPREVIKAVYGCALTVDEQMKLGTSALSHVIDEEKRRSGACDEKNADGISSVDAESDHASSSSSDVPLEEPSVTHLSREESSVGHTTDTSNMQDLLSQLQTNEMNSEKPSQSNTDKSDGGQRNGKEIKKEKASSIPAYSIDIYDPDETEELIPFKDDLDYLSDGFKAVEAACKLHNLRAMNPEDRRFSDSNRRVEVMQSEAEAKCRKANSILSERIALTKKQGKGSFRPRIELLVDKLQLTTFERMVLLTLVGSVLSQDVRKALRSDPNDHHGFDVTVGKLLRTHCNGDLREEIKSRAHFYRNATLIRSGIVSAVPESRYTPVSDLGDLKCELDHMVLDYVAGLETELNEIMDSARCYKPKVDMQSVILRDDVKTMVLQRAENFELFRRMRRELGFDDIVRYGKGLTICFHGKSGTGKTLFANALAAHLGKKMLLVNFTSMRSSDSEADPYKIIFREAKIHGAIVFMDECDEMFESRDGGGRGGGTVTAALREMEMFDGIMILATNRPQVLDEAMHRRIAMSVHFEPPDAKQRLAIWRRHVPKQLNLAEDVDLKALAIEFELTGGYIKNAMFQALSVAVNRAALKTGGEKTNGSGDTQGNVKSSNLSAADLRSEHVLVTMEDLQQACRLQAHGDLKRAELDHKLIPVRGLDSLVASEETMETLRKVVAAERVRGHLAARWGFKDRRTRSTCVLVLGPSGCGKSLVADCLGYETGRPLQQITASELHNFKRNGSTGGWGIEDMFEQAAVAGAVVVVEEAEQLLFETANPLVTASPGLELLFHMRRFDGLVVLCCTTAVMASDAGWDAGMPIPDRVAALLHHIVWLRVPDRAMRVRLWKQLIPKETPVDEKVFEQLDAIAAKFEFTGARIATCVRRSAVTAAARLSERNVLEDGSESEGVDGMVTVEDVWGACEDEVRVSRGANAMSDWVRHLYA